MKFTTKVTGIGEMVEELINEGNLVIVFNDNAPPELMDVAVRHTPAELPQPVKAGDIVRFGENEYKVTAVGDEANHTLKNLGHCTFKFSGNPEVELPGQIELDGKGIVPDIKVDDIFEIEFV